MLHIPAIPHPVTLWRPIRGWIWAAYLVLIAAAIPDLFVQFWFNRSLGYHAIFWTNLTAQVLVGGVFGALVYAAITIPMRLYTRRLGLRRAAVHVALWGAIFGGWRAADHYDAFLLAIHGTPFG